MLIDGSDFVVRGADLPGSIKAFTSVDPEGVANIFINDYMTQRARIQAFSHEYRHLQNNDLWSDVNIRVIEGQSL